jgi:hypothetical protein
MTAYPLNFSSESRKPLGFRDKNIAVHSGINLTLNKAALVRRVSLF